MQNKKDYDGDDYEDKFDRTKQKAKDNAKDAKHQASNAVEDFKHQAEKAKHEVAKVIPQPVKDTSDKIGDKAHQVKV